MNGIRGCRQLLRRARASQGGCRFDGTQYELITYPRLPPRRLTGGSHPPTTDDPRHEFPAEFLLKELVPVMGGHLGETLIRHVGRTWVARQPVLKSMVRVHSRG